jgi:hypothetical protein
MGSNALWIHSNIVPIKCSKVTNPAPSASDCRPFPNTAVRFRTIKLCNKKGNKQTHFEKLDFWLSLGQRAGAYQLHFLQGEQIASLRNCRDESKDDHWINE